MIIARRFQLYASAKVEVNNFFSPDFVRFLTSFPQSFMELYTQILDAGGPAFSAVFEHVRDRPDEGLLFHCTGAALDSGNVSEPSNFDLSPQPGKIGRVCWLL